MRPSFPAALSCAAACALFVTSGVAFQAAPQAAPPAGSQSADARRPDRAGAVSAARNRRLAGRARHPPVRGRPARGKSDSVEGQIQIWRNGRSCCRRRDLPRCRPAPAEVRRAALCTEGQRTGRHSAADARDRHRTRGATGSWHDPLDDRQRRSRVLFEDRRLRAAIHPHDARQLRRADQAGVPARSLPARPRRHRARAAVHDEVDDGLHVEAARPWRRSLHAAAVQPLHECEPLRRRNRRFRGHRVCREGLPDRSETASS